MLCRAVQGAGSSGPVYTVRRLRLMDDEVLKRMRKDWDQRARENAQPAPSSRSGAFAARANFRSAQ